MSKRNYKQRDYMSLEEAVGKVVLEAQKLGKSVQFVNQKLFIDEAGGTCAAFYDEDNGIIAVATKKDKHLWVGNLLHEYMHIVQEYRGYTKYIHDEAYDIYTKYMTGGRVSYKRFCNAIEIMRIYELDCEKRVLRFIKRNKVTGIPVDDYIKGINSYMYIFTAVKKYSEWTKKSRSPYMVKKIRKLLPTKIDTNFTRIPANIEPLILKHCIKGIKE